MLVLSLLSHGAVFALIALLPAPVFGVEAMPGELEFMVMPEPEPVVQAPEPLEAPEPEPEVQPEVAAAAPAPRRRRRRVEEEVDPEPAPPAPVMTAEPNDGPAAGWEHPAGDENGVPGGVPGGTGTGSGTAAAVSEAAPEPRRGLSRAELRNRVMGYIRGLTGSLMGQVDYPLAARRESLQGVVVLRLRLAADGRVLAVRISRSSGHGVLDDAALASVQRITTLPAPPAGVPWDEARELPVPIRFRLQ